MEEEADAMGVFWTSCWACPPAAALPGDVEAPGRGVGDDVKVVVVAALLGVGGWDEEQEEEQQELGSVAPGWRDG